MRRSASPAEWAAVALILAGAAALRLVDLGSVAGDPFYDAAVRSMTRSWHNLFFGAFEPGGSVSIDKPPLDLWLQVASVKLLGFGSTSLKLPQALAGTASVGLLYVSVRRVFGVAAALAAAVALAVLPIEVITARSDTMDALMMALIVLALLCVVRACESGGTGWLLAAAAALGLAFNVKLLESLVALPGLAVIAWLGLPRTGATDAQRGRTRRGRALQLLAAAAVLVAVSLSWLTATLLFPAHDRPFAIGSTDGSAWNAAFVFNGVDRIDGRSIEAPQPGLASRHPPEATQTERDRISITAPSPTRLLARVGPLSGERLGLEALAALLLGVPAILLGVRGPPGTLRRAMGIGLIVWLLIGIALFSQMQRLHPRYVEAFTPAVAALLGIGAAWASSGKGRAPLLVLGGYLVVMLLYAEHLLFGRTSTWWLALLAALGALALAGLARLRETPEWLRSILVPGGVLALTLVAVLAIPLRASIEAIQASTSDAGNVGALPAAELASLSSYLRAHQGAARYEVAADSATKIGALVVRDARPVVVLTTYGAQTLTSVAALRRLIARGEVRYAFLSTGCGPHTPRTDAGCSTPALWVRAHGVDVSRQAGLTRGGVLWRLPGAVA